MHTYMLLVARSRPGVGMQLIGLKAYIQCHRLGRQVLPMPTNGLGARSQVERSAGPPTAARVARNSDAAAMICYMWAVQGLKEKPGLFITASPANKTLPGALGVLFSASRPQ